MAVLDTNLIIYIAKGRIGRKAFAGQELAYSVITRIEALGFPELTLYELRNLESMFNNAIELPMTDEVVELAIAIRQTGRIKLGDAIIAATALENDQVLWTTNTKDFKDIEDLRLHNPLAT